MVDTTTTQDTTTTTSAPDWRASLPDDIKADPSLESFKDVSSLAKSFIATKSMVGADTVKVPGKNATDAERNAFYAKLGRPEKPEGYILPTEGMPENFKADEGRLASMREAAHRAGISDQQFAALARADATFLAEQMGQFEQGQTATREQNVNALKREWGKAFDQNLALAKRAVTFSGGDELAKVLDESGFGNHPAVIKAMAKMGRMIADDEVIGGGRSASMVLSPAEANSRIMGLYADDKFMAAYRSKHHAGHEEAVKKMRELAEMADVETEQVGA